jgi:hypothetical protein
VAAAAGLLQTLVASSNPPAELRAMLARDTGDPPEHATLDTFAAALAYFERPNRRADIAALHARAHALYLKSLADQELELLRAKAVRKTAPSPRRQPGLLDRVRPKAAQAGLVMVLLAAILASVYQLVSMALPETPPPAVEAVETAGAAGASLSPTSIIQSAGMQVRQLVAAALSVAGVRMSAAPSLPDPAAARTRAERTRVAADDAVARSHAIDAALSRPSAGPANVEWTVSVRDVTAAYTGSGEGQPSQSDGFEDDSLPIFSALDGDVDPAMLVRPQLPSRTAASDDPDVSTLDLIVDRRGQVERVRLDATRSRLNEKMLVSAAKAWIFQPAVRFGHPVRYRLRVQITE